MSENPNIDVVEGFSDAAAAIMAYANHGAGGSLLAEMVMPMDELEKFRLITALIHLIANPTHDTQEGQS